MATVKQHFGQCFELSNHKEAPLWDLPFSFDTPILELLIYTYETEIIHSGDDPERIIGFGKAMLADIIELRKNEPGERVLINYLQFHASVDVLQYFSDRRMNGYCFDWICNGLSDSIAEDGQCTFDPVRLTEFTATENPYIQNNLLRSLKRWCQDLFYYSSYTGGHKPLADIFIDHCLGIFLKIMELQPDTLGVNALCQMCVWCTTYKKQQALEQCSTFLATLYRNSADQKINKIIALHFAFADYNGTTRTKAEWCIQALSYEGLLNPQELLQIKINVTGRDIGKISREFDDIIAAIKNFRQATPAEDLDSYYLNRMFTLFYRTFHTLLHAGKVDMVNQLIGTFYSLSQEQQITGNNLYIIPNDNHCVVYAFEGTVFYNERDNDSIKEIIRLENKFLGGSHQLNDVLDFEPEMPQREIGQPAPNKSQAYYQALSQMLGLQKLLEKPGFENLAGFNCLYGTMLPIQSMITKQLGITLPVIHSHQQPLPQRQIVKVCIWQGETQLAEQEQAGLSAVFASAGILVEIMVAAGSTKANFLDHYHNPDFDVFWIISHGQYDHYTPHNSYLDLGNGIHIKAAELDYRNEKAERRLLLLDVCDGSTITMNNNFFARGIGPSLVNSHQSLIAHCWPVADLAAMAYGLLIANSLSQQFPFAKAHANSLLLLSQGREKVISFLEALWPDMEALERLHNSGLDFENFYYWGSLNYFE